MKNREEPHDIGGGVARRRRRYFGSRFAQATPEELTVSVRELNDDTADKVVVVETDPDVAQTIREVFGGDDEVVIVFTPGDNDQ